MDFWFANQSWIESFQKKIRINFLSLFLQKNSNEIRINDSWLSDQWGGVAGQTDRQRDKHLQIIIYRFENQRRFANHWGSESRFESIFKLIHNSRFRNFWFPYLESQAVHLTNWAISAWKNNLPCLSLTLYHGKNSSENCVVAGPGFGPGTLRSAAPHSTNELSFLGKVNGLVYVFSILWLWLWGLKRWIKLSIAGYMHGNFRNSLKPLYFNLKQQIKCFSLFLKFPGVTLQ